ncbi:uncharacterized protein LOC122274454 [Carya illinoinensis]|uniref:SHSP domain-containing protein n=1 Tax=Carya illinoinensis TaxID=32201 RepID=A0A8T1PQE0_CARIL|nr:uncharacterized protein LOC122274454 [Carya illinoinensis]KAG6645215.1 hypothetical protein CIPAW_08G107100 [Carya illinoinensis]
MKVPSILSKRNIASQYEDASKKLRRLPHVFARVLELPIHSSADVSVEETSDSFRFTAATPANTDHTTIAGDVRAHTIKIFPGVTKIVIRGVGSPFLDELKFDLWRFRLPASTRLDMASARYSSGGELVVTVPKGLDEK